MLRLSQIKLGGRNGTRWIGQDIQLTVVMQHGTTPASGPWVNALDYVTLGRTTNLALKFVDRAAVSRELSKIPVVPLLGVLPHNLGTTSHHFLDRKYVVTRAPTPTANGRAENTAPMSQ